MDRPAARPLDGRADEHRRRLAHAPPGMSAVAQTTQGTAAHILTIAPATARGRWFAAYWRAGLDGVAFVDAVEEPLLPADLAELVADLAPGIDWSAATWRLEPHPEITPSTWTEQMSRIAAGLAEATRNANG